MLLNLNAGGVKFRRANFILSSTGSFFMDLKIFLSVIQGGSLSLDLMFCNRYLHQLESTQETDSIDVFLKIDCPKTSWSETNKTYR